MRSTQLVRAIITLVLLQQLPSCTKSTNDLGGTVNNSKADTVSTLAGNDTAGFADGTGAYAKFNHPWGVAVDAQANVYVADHGNNCIRKISVIGIVTTLAGGIQGFANGIGTDARFNGPNVIAVDAQANVYVADQGNNLIRKISPTGVVITLAGNGYTGKVNGMTTEAEFNRPSGVAVDAQGNVYVADQWNNCIRKITSLGMVSTLAGGIQGFSDGTGINAEFNGPNGIAVNSQGNVYVAEIGNNRIRQITPTGVVTTFAGNGNAGFADGVGTNAEFNIPLGVAIDAADNIYIADQGNNRIRKITTSRVVSTLAGNGNVGFADGTGANAKFAYPWGVAVGSQGYVYIADMGNNRIRKIPTK